MYYSLLLASSFRHLYSYIFYIKANSQKAVSTNNGRCFGQIVKILALPYLKVFAFSIVIFQKYEQIVLKQKGGFSIAKCLLFIVPKIAILMQFFSQNHYCNCFIAHPINLRQRPLLILQSDTNTLYCSYFPLHFYSIFFLCIIYLSLLARYFIFRTRALFQSTLYHNKVVNVTS